MLGAITFGDSSIRANFKKQLNELSSDAADTDGMAGKNASQEWPSKLRKDGNVGRADRVAIIGEIGTPWDMKKHNGLLGLTKGKLKREDYDEPAKVSGLPQVAL